MKKKKLVTMGLAAALIVTGCAANGASNAQPESAQEAETVQAEAAQETEGKQEAEAGASQDTSEPAQDTAEAGIEKYESSDGWSVSYDSSYIELIEDDAVYFKYMGEAEGTNQISVMYYPDKMPDEVLTAAISKDTDGEIPEHTRREGYFAGRTDVWSMIDSMDSVTFPDATDDFIGVERNGGTLLVQITTTKQADDETGMQVSDALASVVDSFELNDQQPQTYSQYVPGKYVTTFEDGIEGEESAEYYVQFNENHTGLIHIQDDISVIWYSRDGVVLNADTGEQIYEYDVEGDSLYLTDYPVENAQTLEFTK
jgi:hypothetical protein